MNNNDSFVGENPVSKDILIDIHETQLNFNDQIPTLTARFKATGGQRRARGHTPTLDGQWEEHQRFAISTGHLQMINTMINEY